MRSQIWIDTGNTYYTSYFDFERLAMTAQFWRNG